MKALTLHQPWASLVASGRKVYETRSWAPPPALLGQRIAIHAGQSRAGAPFARKLGLSDLPIGAVVCTVRLVAVHRMTSIHAGGRGSVSDLGCSSWGMAQRRDPDFREPGSIPLDPYGDYSAGRWAWRFVDVQVLDPPVAARGRQRLWNWEEPGYIWDE